ncbi:MAG: hypothetical protein JWQ48_4209 [Conexibacter sp.]|nr:hypothetical protein [Conexibacter sp.]
MSALLAAAPALPLHTAGPYVAAAYIFFLAILVIYVAIMATKLQRMKRDLNDLGEQLEARDARRAAADEPAGGADVAATPQSDADAVAARTVVKAGSLGPGPRDSVGELAQEARSPEREVDR